MSRAASWNLGTLNSTTLDRLTKDVCKVKEKKKNLCSLAFLNWNDLHYFFYLLQIVNRQPWPIITTHTSSKSQENCHLRCFFWTINTQHFRSDQIRSVAQSCPTLCDPMNHSTPCLPVPHQLPEFTQTHVHWVITRWSTLKSDWLYSLQPKMEKLYTVSKNKTRSWLWLRPWTPYCQIQT